MTITETSAEGKKHFMNSLQYTGWAKIIPFIVGLRFITSPNINRF